MPKLSRKMISTISQASGFTEYLTFTTGDTRCALEIMRLREVIEYQDITPVPGMPAFLPGLINVRWDMIPVIDMVQILQSSSAQTREKQDKREIHDSRGGEGSEGPRDANENTLSGNRGGEARDSGCKELIFRKKQAGRGDWLIITYASLEKENMQVGILADQVDDVIQLGNDEISPPHELGARIHPRFLQGIGDVGNFCLFILDINTIVSFVHEMVKEKRE